MEPTSEFQKCVKNLNLTDPPIEEEVMAECLHAHSMLNELEIPVRTGNARLSLWGRIAQAIMKENNGKGEMSEKIINLVRSNSGNYDHFSVKS